MWRWPRRSDWVRDRKLFGVTSKARVQRLAAAWVKLGAGRLPGNFV